MTFLARVLLSLAIACQLSCHQLRPDYPTTTLEGRVTIRGAPIDEGWVTLLPMGPAVGELVIMPIQRDGRFATKRSPIGPLGVRVNLPRSTTREMRDLQPAFARRLQILGGPSSPLRAVAREGENRVEIDLYSAVVR